MVYLSTLHFTTYCFVGKYILIWTFFIIYTSKGCGLLLWAKCPNSKLPTFPPPTFQQSAYQSMGYLSVCAFFLYFIYISNLFCSFYIFVCFCIFIASFSRLRQPTCLKSLMSGTKSICDSFSPSTFQQSAYQSMVTVSAQLCTYDLQDITLYLSLFHSYIYIFFFLFIFIVHIFGLDSQRVL